MAERIFLLRQIIPRLKCFRWSPCTCTFPAVPSYVQRQQAKRTGIRCFRNGVKGSKNRGSAQWFPRDIYLYACSFAPAYGREHVLPGSIVLPTLLIYCIKSTPKTYTNVNEQMWTSPVSISTNGIRWLSSKEKFPIFWGVKWNFPPRISNL